MKKIWYSLLLSVTALNLQAQSKNEENRLNFLSKELRKKTQNTINIDTISTINKSLDSLFLATSSNSIKSDIHFLRGHYFYRVSNYEEAMNSYLKAAEGFEKENDSIGISMALNNISLILNVSKEFGKSLGMKKRALLFCPKTGEERWKIMLLNNIGATYRDLSKIDSAAFYNNFAYKLSKVRKDSFGLATYHYQSALTLLKQKEYLKMLPYLDTIQNFFKDYVSRPQYENALFYFAKALNELEEYDKALAEIKKSTALIRSSGMSINISENLALMSTIYSNLGDKENALSALKESIIYKDSIFDLDKNKAVLDMELKYQTEKKERENLLLKQQATEKDLALSNKNNQLLIGGIGAILVLSLLSLFWIGKVGKEKVERIETEQKLRRSQINPHFFFNVLTAIQQKVVLAEDKKETVTYISKFSKLMRQTLETSFNEFIALEQEIEMLENYIKLQVLRYKDRFTYEILNNCEDDLQIPTQIIQPFVENAIEHGFKNLDHKGKLSISFTELDPKTLEIKVKDNGRVSDDGQLKNKSHISRSRQIIQGRLALFGTKNKYRHSFETGAEGSLVTIHAPFK
ncbi:MAG: histidine kinase [Croceivirga sp.]